MTCLFLFSWHPLHFFWFLGYATQLSLKSPLQHFFSLSLYRHLLLSLITGDTFNDIWPSSFGSPRDVQLFALEETRRAVSHRWWTNSLNFGGGSEYFTYNYDTVDGRNPTPIDIVNIPFFTGFLHPRWCRISSINSICMCTCCCFMHYNKEPIINTTNDFFFQIYIVLLVGFFSTDRIQNGFESKTFMAKFRFG